MRGLSRVKWCLLGITISIVVLVAGSAAVPDKIDNALSWLADSDFAGNIRELITTEHIEENDLVEMVVDRVEISYYQAVVLLKEKGAERYLPIAIGPAEAMAIEVALDEVYVPRPLTHDLLCSAVNVAGADVNRIIITSLQDDIFYARIMLTVSWEQIEIDSRPSDAIAIALRVGAPVYVKEAVLGEAGIQLGEKAIF